jgi:hypothetical protein
MLRMNWIRSPERLTPLILHWNTQAGVHNGETSQSAREEEVFEEVPAVLQALLQLFPKLLVLPVRGMIRPIAAAGLSYDTRHTPTPC